MKSNKNENVHASKYTPLSDSALRLTIVPPIIPAVLLLARAIAALVETTSMFTENQSAQCRGEWPPYDNGNFQGILLKYKIRQSDIQELETQLATTPTLVVEESLD